MPKVTKIVNEPTVVQSFISCDVCGASTKDSPYLEFATLSADWGYDSSKDGEHHVSYICEKCYDRLLEQFKITPLITDYFENSRPVESIKEEAWELSKHNLPLLEELNNHMLDMQLTAVEQSKDSVGLYLVDSQGKHFGIVVTANSDGLLCNFSEARPTKSEGSWMILIESGKTLEKVAMNPQSSKIVFTFDNMDISVYHRGDEKLDAELMCP